MRLELCKFEDEETIK